MIAPAGLRAGLAAASGGYRALCAVTLPERGGWDDGRVSPTTARRLAWAVFAVVLLLWLTALVLEWLTRGVTHGTTVGNSDVDFLLTLVTGVMLLLFPLCGLLIATRRPDNAIGWLLLAIGAGWSALAGAVAWAELRDSRPCRPCRRSRRCRRSFRDPRLTCRRSVHQRPPARPPACHRFRPLRFHRSVRHPPAHHRGAAPGRTGARTRRRGTAALTGPQGAPRSAAAGTAARPWSIGSWDSAPSRRPAPTSL